MSKQNPDATTQRRIRPSIAPSAVPVSAPDAVPDASSDWTGQSHGDYGNQLLSASYGGAELEGLGQTLVAEMALASAGVAGQADQLASMVALRKVMRDAMHLDVQDKAAVDGIGSCCVPVLLPVPTVSAI